uniref:Glycosyltransferase n=1 Tax=viral metagenome TaxID=1070528 RepID=A0A6C0KUA3_9ZZZZ
MESYGFIILRNVNILEHNFLWVNCYNCIRKYYPEIPIVIIDDNSNKEILLLTQELHNTTIINSEYIRRGELLPYYYYANNKFFDTAIIIHDSVFINKYIDFTVDNYNALWNFEHNWDQIDDETKMIKLFNDDNLLQFYENKSLWKGCFGGMTIITHKFLSYINKKYDLSKLLDLVLTRYNRCSFERVIGCLLQKEEQNDSLFGDIHKYQHWGINFDDYFIKKNTEFKDLYLIKVNIGR